MQVAGDRCGSGQSLPGERKLPRPVLLHREAPEVLPNWSSAGGKERDGVTGLKIVDPVKVAQVLLVSMLGSLCRVQ